MCWPGRAERGGRASPRRSIVEVVGQFKSRYTIMGSVERGNRKRWTGDGKWGMEGNENENGVTKESRVGQEVLQVDWHWSCLCHEHASHTLPRRPFPFSGPPTMSRINNKHIILLLPSMY